MKAIAIVPGTTQVSLVDIEEPRVSQPDEVKIKMEAVGICGTDREEVSGGRADAPAGKERLVIGHEMFGKVVEVGADVHSVKPGDYGVFMVRRGCGKCKACMKGRSDMCYTGAYTERGIKGADGYQAEFVVDREAFLVHVPAHMRPIGVLTEPMSVAAKAIDEALVIQQARLRDFENDKNWLKGKKALVAGIGPIGLMAAFALRLHGAEVTGLDIVDEGTKRPSILKGIGGRYVDGRKVQVLDLDDKTGEYDFIFEAAGIAQLQMSLIDALSTNGVYVATGIPAAKRTQEIPAGLLIQQMVLKNQVMVGSVNASITHYKMAVDYLEKRLKTMPGLITSIITQRFPYKEFDRALHEHGAEEIKVVVEW
jgi:threonine dehydrogenase-like Zn-dependent dehydrogenase